MVDSQIIDLFKQFQKETRKYSDFDIEKLVFADIDLFNDKNILLKGSLKLENHDKLEKINDANGLPVYDASANILTYVDENKYKSCVFENKNKKNPDLSFANEGNSSAGTNFIFHTGKYFVNNHRTVIDFSKTQYYSKYVYYNIKDMKEEYGFKRGYIPSQTELKKLAIKIPIPKDIDKTYTSYKIQEVLVEFIEYFSNKNNKNIDVVNNEVTPLIDKFEAMVLPHFFAKEEKVRLAFNNFAKRKGYEIKLEDIEFDSKLTSIIGEFKGGSSSYTQKYITDNKGAFPVYSASTDKKTKGISGYINSFDYDEETIHITKNGEKTGTVFYFQKHKHSLNGDRAIYIVEKKYFIKYIYYCLKELRLDEKHDWGNKLSKTKFYEYQLIIPKATNKYSSYELQEIFVEFIEKYFKRINEMRELSQYLIDKYKLFTETLIAKTLKV